MKGLFLSYNSLTGKATGGTLIASRNLNYFKSLDEASFKIDVYDSNTILLESANRTTEISTVLKNILNFQTPSFNNSFLEILFARIAKEGVNYIFLDSTLFGVIAKKIKLKFPSIKIITYSHNVELTSSWHAIRYEFSFKKIYTLIFSFINEKYSIKYSDYLIGISSYDDKIYKRIYNRNFDSIIPVTIEDKNNIVNEQFGKNENDRLQILFVGSYFYPNIHGIKWFIDNVIDNIDADLIIVGSGMGVLEKTYPNHEKVQFYDFVKDLGEYYIKSHIVISPIFIGSGMKVKVAEALMFGKIIVGTHLAFQGYNIDEANCHICQSKEDFIRKINDLKYLLKDKIKYSEKARKTFLKYYSNSNETKYFLATYNFLNEKLA